jgi:hypothetical protein
MSTHLEQLRTPLEQCRRLIEASLDWGDPASWTNEDFEGLSDRIFAKTSVRLSVSTLKRIWGKVKYDHSPTTATLNALARYAGFEGWRDLANHNRPVPSEARDPSPATQQPRVTEKAPRPTVTPLIIGTVAIGILLALFSARLHPSSSAAPLHFESRRTSDGLPNSVVFDYDATPLHPHEVMIQQSWDPQRREKVNPNGKEHSSIYYYPGYFLAKLVVDGKTRLESEVFIPTSGWKGIIRRSPMPVYLSKEEIKCDSGRMGITAPTLQEKTGSSVFSDTWTSFDNVREFPAVRGDSFRLDVTVRNTSTVEQCLCRNVLIFVLGKSSAVIIPLADKGCIAALQLLPGYVAINGKDHDLSAFGCDFSGWQHVVCTESGHVLRIALNGRPIFTLPGVRSIGDIIGVRIAFEGTGEVGEIKLAGAGGAFTLLSGNSHG